MPKRLNASLTGSVLTAERSIPSTPRAEMMQLLDGAAFSAVFESSGEALLVVDSLGTVRRANRRSREMLRFSEARERQKSLADHISAPSESDLLSWCRRTPSSMQSKRCPAREAFRRANASIRSRTLQPT